MCRCHGEKGEEKEKTRERGRVRQKQRGADSALGVRGLARELGQDVQVSWRKRRREGREGEKDRKTGRDSAWREEGQGEN